MSKIAKHFGSSFSPVRGKGFVRVEGLEPPCLAAPDPKSGMSTNFTTPAVRFRLTLAVGIAAIRRKRAANVGHLFAPKTQIISYSRANMNFITLLFTLLPVIQ